MGVAHDIDGWGPVQDGISGGDDDLSGRRLVVRSTKRLPTSSSADLSTEALAVSCSTRRLYYDK